MDDLTDGSGGLWAVSTVSGSSYLLDLDARIMLRKTDPYADGRDDHPLRRDGDPVHLIRLLHCAIGDGMVLVVNLGVDGVAFTTRRSTTVIRIEELRDPYDAGP
jgi:hypothetical protein